MPEKKVTTKKTADKPEKAVKTVKAVKEVKAAKPAAAVKAVKAEKTVKAEKVEKIAVKENKVADSKYTYSVGKRKSATAQIRLYQNGSGKITVNNLPMAQYFSRTYDVGIINAPAKQAGLKDFDLTIVVKGGGKTGQAEAVRHAITKALVELNSELRPAMKAKGWLKRDARVKERKKPGLKKARRAPQWSKR